MFALGAKGGMGRKLSEWTGWTENSSTGRARLIETHCLAHRLQLAVKRAFGKKSKFSFWWTFESWVNALYSYYYNKGHKRKAHLDATSALADDATILSLNYIFDVRWVSSELSAIVKIINGFKKLVQDLEEIERSGQSFNQDARAKARGLLTNFYDKNLVLMMHWMCDILKVIQHSSLQFQKRYGTLISQMSNIEEFKGKIRLLGSEDGYYLKDPLDKSICGDVKCRDIKHFQNSRVVLYNGIKIQERSGRSDGYYPKLSDVRSEMVEALLREISSYFPIEELENYNIFDPKTWPSKQAELFFYGQQELRQIHQSLHKNSFDIDLSDDWQNMISNIIKSHEFDRYQDSDPIFFWYRFINKGLVPEKIKKLVQTVLSVPIGSADCERAFSILFHIRTKRRAKLTPQHLEDLLRIRMNGPKDPTKFAAFKYAKEWVKRGHWKTDAPQSVVDEAVDKTLNEEDEDILDELRFQRKLLDGSALF